MNESIGTRNRVKGHHAERFYAKVFKDLGYTKCVTARLGGRIFDNAGIDIINIPFNIQIKSGKQAKLSPGKVLLNMHSQIDSLFPENHEVRGYPLFVIHRPNPFSKNFDEDIVYMTYNQYMSFNLPILYQDLKIRKARMSTDFGAIVSIKFYRLFNIKFFDIKDGKDLLQQP